MSATLPRRQAQESACAAAGLTSLWYRPRAMRAGDGCDDRLRALLRISSRLAEAEEPEALVRVILESAQHLFAAEGCSIALIDSARGELIFTSAVGGSDLAETRIGLHQGVVGWVTRHGEGVVTNDAAGNDHFFPGIDAKTGFTTRSLLCAPLSSEGRTIGAIEVVNTRQREGFSQADLTLLAALAEVATAAIVRTRAYRSLADAHAILREEVSSRHTLVVGESPIMAEVVQTARRAAETDATVLLLGESGTGKEVLARAIHQWSPRAGRPFVAVNCVALTPELLESELFGHERGAFTGAVTARRGRFELAHGGTIFLDEIGDLALPLQAKLLRVLQEREIQHVGGNREIRVDVRIIAATNHDLAQAVRDNTFREDLYYRLNVVTLSLPPLREHAEDLPQLVAHFLERGAREMKRPGATLSRAAMEVLRAYPWPGNVRELQNAIERALVLAPGECLEVEDLPAEIRPGGAAAAAGAEAIGEDLPLSEAVVRFKRQRVRRALAASGGNQTEAARALGMRQPNLSRLIKSLGI